MVQTETIAVNQSQKKRLRDAAQSRVAYWRERGRKHVKLEAYFKPLPKKIKRNFKAGCGPTPHFVVRVARGLRKQANIHHKSKVRIKYRGHKRGIACYVNIVGQKRTRTQARRSMKLPKLGGNIDAERNLVPRVDPDRYRLAPANAELRCQPPLINDPLTGHCTEVHYAIRNMRMRMYDDQLITTLLENQGLTEEQINEGFYHADD